MAFISSKRQLDDVDDRELDDFIKRKTAMRKYPPPKIRIGVQAVRDFPPGCGILQDSTESKADTKPSKKLEIEKSRTFEDNKLKSYKPKELGFNKPTGKVKFWDPTEQLVRDFPPISGIKDERKPLKNLNNVDSKLGFNKARDSSEQVVRDFPPVSGIKDERKPLKNPNNVDSKLGFNKSYIATRPSSKVKFYDPTSSNDDNALKPEPTITIASQKEQIRREKIRDAMVLFDDVYTQLFKENQTKQKGEKMGPCKVPMEASRMVKQKLKWMNADKALGQIRGIQPGDIFKFRSQLHMVGLHCQPHCGIDYTKINGKSIAISIVDSHRYSNESQTCELTYCGEGGNGVSEWSQRNVTHEDQKLERGNLALKNSMSEKNPVRVIKKVFGFGKKGNDVFVYDGLYTVNQCTQKRGEEGKMVFMFQLHKMDGQSNVQRMVNAMSGDVGLNHHSTFQML